MTLNFDEDYLFSLAKASIEHGLIHGAPLILNPRLQQENYREPAIVGVSIFIGQSNLGCQINSYNKKPLHKAVTQSAYDAGFKDNRFLPVNKNLLSKASIEITFLLDQKSTRSKLTLSELAKEIQKNDTVSLILGSSNAFMFSSMQKFYPDIKEYLKAIRLKAKIPESVSWESITALLTKTEVLEAKPYSEIKCLNTNLL